MRKMCLLLLTCANKTEAETIAKTLLEKKLIVCAKKLPVSSASLWKGTIESSQEMLLMMESIEEHFGKIEREVRKLHSYETFVLFSLPISKTTKAVKAWIGKELIR